MTRADDIQNEQSKLQRELDKIQSECNHHNKSIKWSQDEKNYRWQCDTCNARLSYPTIFELDKYIK